MEKIYLPEKRIFQSLFLIALLLFLNQDIDTKAGLEQDTVLVSHQAGDEDDPLARWRFEWLKTRDPFTKQIPSGIRQRELAFAGSIPAIDQIRLMRGTGQRERKWKQRGPYNIGGRTRALAVDVSNETNILAGGVSGGMWRSIDSGANWTKTTEPEQLHSVTTIAQDPRSGHTDLWYYGTGEYLGNSASADGGYYSGDGIFKSTNGGVSWSPLSGTVSNTPQVFDSFFDYIWRIRVSPENGYVFVATYSRIYRSKDGGISWGVSLAPSDSYASYADLAVTSTGILYAALSSGTDKSGIYRSADNGDTWTAITPTGFPNSYNRLVVALAPSNENVLYLLGELGGSGPENHVLWKYVYASGDGSGAVGSWTDLSTNIPAYGGAVGDFDSQSGYDLVVEVKPDDENTVYIGGTNLYLSTSGFADTSSTSWIGGYATANNISQYKNQHSDQHALVFLPSDPKVLYAGHDGGVSRTEDDTNTEMVWESLNNGYSTTQFYHVSLDPTGTKKSLLMGGMQDNGTWSIDSDDASSSWSVIGSGDGAYSAFAKEGQVFIFSSQNGNVFLNDYRNPLNWSSGLTWFGLTPKGASDMLFINPFILDPSDDNIIYYAGGQTVWRNNNIDMSNSSNYELDSELNYYVSTQWEQLKNTSVSEQISSLGASKASPAYRLYYGTSDGKVYRLEGANEGTNTPTEVTSSSFPSGGYVSSIAVDPTDGDKAMLVFSNYSVISVWYTTHAGTTWTNVSGNLEENMDGTGDGPSVRTALILIYGETPLYLVGTSTGLYSTNNLNDSSTEWVHEGSKLIGNVVVDALAGRDFDGTVAVGTHGNGVFSSTSSTDEGGLVTSGDNFLPDLFSLHQNYPNPFNPSTTIRYDIAEETHVALTVYDLMGKQIVSLVSESQAAGVKTVVWDGTDASGSNVSAGVYFYRLTAGPFMMTKKMVVMK